MSRPFVHLHVHSDYSLLDGACTLGKLVKKAAANEMPALALTDHGSLFGAVQFFQKARSAGVKPIIGCEVYIVPNSRLEKNSQQERRHHLVLLARNETGYRNLCHLVSRAYLEGFYYKPRIDFELLEKHADGLIGLSACLQGEIASLLGMDELEQARQAALRYQSILGEGHFYLELQDHGIPEQKQVNEKMITLSRETGIPLVATNDCHYMEADDAEAHEVLVCIQTGKTLSDENRMQLSTQEFYFKTGDEMAAIFSHVPEALDNTLRVAEACNFEFDLASQHYPEFEIPDGSSLDDYFERITREGFAERRRALETEAAAGILRYPLADYEQRLEYEIEVIKKLKYSRYFLIVWDFIRHARENGIPVGPGRGSAAGSLVAYSLRITDIDPLRYDLLFERFLNPERISPPDIDIDFCTRKREDVIHYVTEKYGKDCVCQIITFGTMKARAVVRDVGRVLGMSYGEVDRIAKLVPQELNITLDEALEKEPRLEEAMRDDPQIQKLLEISRRLEGLSRHSSIHAAGVVIAPRPLMDIIPLSTGSDGETVTQYTMKDVEKLGLLKMDFLGLITLTVIDDALHMITRNHGINLDIDHIPLDDEATYQIFADGRTAGIFQFESSGMRGYMKSLKPGRFEDLIAMNALYRPGPIKGGMVDEFIRRKHGESAIAYLLPQLEPILKSTYGVIVYQEQVMQIASQVAGFSLAEADTLRKAMGKKQMEIMAKMEIKFVDGCVERGIERKKAQELFTLMKGFAEYGFNKSHSAAYAWVAYQTAYLKAHYPLEFMAALLTSEKNNTKKVVQYISECKAMGIKILPPSINESELDFLPGREGIRFGLGALKNVGDSAIQIILKARNSDGPFKSFTDFCCRVDLRAVNSRVIESLIKSGVFDELDYKRSQLSLITEKTVEYAQKHQRDLAVGQRSLFGALAGDEPEDTAATENLPAIDEWDKRKILSAEKEILGFYISGHPLDEHRDTLDTCADTTLDQITEESAGRTFRIGCVLTDIKQKKTRRGDRMCLGLLEDLKGTIDFVIYPKTFQANEDLVEPDLPLLVVGVCDVEEGGALKIVVNELLPLNEARDHTVTMIRLEIDLERLTEQRARDLADLLDENRGECAVEILMRRKNLGSAYLKANGFLGIRWSTRLKRRIEEITYPGVVQYIH